MLHTRPSTKPAGILELMVVTMAMTIVVLLLAYLILLKL